MTDAKAWTISSVLTTLLLLVLFLCAQRFPALWLWYGVVFGILGVCFFAIVLKNWVTMQ